MSRISDEFFDSLDERVLDILDQPGDNVRDLLVEIEGDRIDMLALNAENERLRSCVVEARHKWGLEQDTNERLRKLLREWTDMDPLRYDSESPCPWCNFDYAHMRHEPDCAFVLARAECGIGAGTEGAGE